MEVKAEEVGTGVETEREVLWRVTILEGASQTKDESRRQSKILSPSKLHVEK